MGKLDGDNSLLLALTATLAWGAWGFCDKLALRSIRPEQAQTVSVVIGFLTLPLCFMAMRSQVAWSWDGRGLAWATVGALASWIATFSCLLALRRGGAGQVAVATSAYPLVTILLAAAVLGERLTPIRMAGVAMVISGLFVLGRE